MALLQTPQKDDAFTAIDFALKGIDGNTYSLDECKGEKGTVVVFICNHCPYVLAIIDRLVETFKILQEKGIGCVAIMPNDTDAYPDDSFENMKIFAQEHGFTFPYLIDETQGTAQAYGAVCTPDFFGFNTGGQLQYRGRLDSAANNAVNENTKPELMEAMLQIAEIGTGPAEQFPSMGCSIKWHS